MWFVMFLCTACLPNVSRQKILRKIPGKKQKQEMSEWMYMQTRPQLVWQEAEELSSPFQFCLFGSLHLWRVAVELTPCSRLPDSETDSGVTAGATAPRPGYSRMQSHSIGSLPFSPAADLLVWHLHFSYVPNPFILLLSSSWSQCCSNWLFSSCSFSVSSPIRPLHSFLILYLSPSSFSYSVLSSSHLPSLCWALECIQISFSDSRTPTISPNDNIDS